MEENKGIKALVDKYGCNLGSYKYILPGSEILRYIGQNVMFIRYEKVNDTWTNSFKPCQIISINNFDPMTMTYDCTYKIEGEEEEKVEKIIPEGYSWGNPEENSVMIRFVPFSIHTAMIEEECFFNRLKKLYNERPSISKEEIETIARSKERDALLKYAHNIGAAVILDNGEYLWIRVHKITIAHKKGSMYNLRFEDNDKNWSFLLDMNNSEFDFNGIGKFKLIDLADYDTEKTTEKTTEKNVMNSTENAKIENLIGFSQPAENA